MSLRRTHLGIVVIAGALAGIALLIALSKWFGPVVSGDPRADSKSGRVPDHAATVTSHPIKAVVPEPAAQDGHRLGWIAVDPDVTDVNRLPDLRETYGDAVLVRLEEELWTMQAGDRVAFSIPQTGEVLESVIDRVEFGLGGSRSYVGRLSDPDALYRVVVTVGTGNAFAFIGSSRGSYELVGNREFGWLMPTAGMDRHVDYSRPDYILPGGGHDGSR